MPKIQWTDLPAALRDHLFERLRERQISADDLYRLKEDPPSARATGQGQEALNSLRIAGL